MFRRTKAFLAFHAHINATLRRTLFTCLFNAQFELCQHRRFGDAKWHQFVVHEIAGEKFTRKTQTHSPTGGRNSPCVSVL